MGKNGKKIMSINTHVRSLYSPSFSSIMITYFNYNLSFHFYKHIGEDHNGLPKYDRNSMTASVNYEGAAMLYLTAVSILDGKNSDKEIKATVSCYNATLIFDYKREPDNQMAAYLVIEKNNDFTPFKFMAHPHQVKNGDQITTEGYPNRIECFRQDA